MIDLHSLAGIRCADLDDNLTDIEKDLFNNFDDRFQALLKTCCQQPNKSGELEVLTEEMIEERQAYVDEHHSFHELQKFIKSDHSTPFRQQYIDEHYSYPDKMPPNMKEGDFIPGYGKIISVCYNKPGTKQKDLNG